MNSTPNKIDRRFNKLARELVDNPEPKFVVVQPAPGSRPSYCFQNVEQVIRALGGREVIGWTLWDAPGLFVEAEFHACWESPTGELIDVTPKDDREDTILFIPDPERKYQGHLVANVILFDGSRRTDRSQCS